MCIYIYLFPTHHHNLHCSRHIRIFNLMRELLKSESIPDVQLLKLNDFRRFYNIYTYKYQYDCWAYSWGHPTGDSKKAARGEGLFQLCSTE